MGRNPYFTGLSFAIFYEQVNENFENESQSLFYWTFFCNILGDKMSVTNNQSQSLFYWTFFCNRNQECLIFLKEQKSQSLFYWTFFCYNYDFPRNDFLLSRNPYFTGLSFAIELIHENCPHKECRNPYFTGLSFAINVKLILQLIRTQSQSLFYWTFFCNNL